MVNTTLGIVRINAWATFDKVKFFTDWIENLTERDSLVYRQISGKILVVKVVEVAKFGDIGIEQGILELFEEAGNNFALAMRAGNIGAFFIGRVPAADVFQCP